MTNTSGVYYRLGRPWPTLIWKPMAPFIVAGGVIFYGVWKAADAIANTDEFRNDPRNLNAKPAKKADH